MKKHLKLSVYIFLFSGAHMLAFLPATAQKKDITLNDAISLAIANNRKLKVGDLGISRARQQIRLARSKALPSVTINGQYAHYFERPVFFGLGDSNNQDNNKLAYARIGGKNQFSTEASLVQPLYDPSVKPELQQARLSEDISTLAYKEDEIEIIAQVKQTYLTILVLDERLKLQHESVNRNKKVLQDARSLYNQGRALRVDTLRAYTTVKNLQPDITRLSDAITIAKLHLTTTLGIGSNEMLALTDSLFVNELPDIPTEEQVYEDAVQSRPELKILSLQEEMAEKKINLAKAGKLPSVSLVGQYQFLTQTNSFPLDNGYWPSVSFVGARISVPLFSGYANSAKVDDAKLAREQSVIQLLDVQEELKVEVRQVVSNLHETSERLETQNAVRETARLSYDIVQYRYEKGVASRLELTDAELALTAAELNYLEAVYDYMTAQIQLDRIAGRAGYEEK